MSNPLAQVTYNQEAGYLPVEFIFGDDLSMAVNLPFDITSYTFSGSVYDQFGNTFLALTTTKTQSTPTGILTVTLTKAQTATLTSGMTYRITWTVGGLQRTFLAGPLVNQVIE